MPNVPNRPDPGLRGHGRAPLSGPHVVLLGSELGSLVLGLARQMYRLVLPHEVFLVAQAVPGGLGATPDVGVYALRPVDLAADLAALAAQEALLGRREAATGTADSYAI